MIGKICMRIRAFGADRGGIAAVEFAIGAPVIAFGLLIMADIGLAFNERMNLDQSMRAGAELVMDGVSDEDDIKNLVIGAATGAYGDEVDDLPDVGKSAPPTVTVSRTNKCPDGSIVSSSSTLCSDNTPPSIYYDLEAYKLYQGLFLSGLEMRSTIKVQVR